MIGPIKFLGKGIYFLRRIIFRYWWVIATVIILLPMMIISINQGIEEKDMRIPLKMVGTTIISSDEGIYEVVQELEFESQEKESLGEKIGYYLEFSWYLIKNLWKHVWMLLAWFILFFKGEKFIMGNDSKNLRAFILAILTMTFLQILVYGIPFKGIYALTKFIIGVL